MFSGLVKGIGRVAARTEQGGDRRFVIELGTAAIPPLAIGGSIAVNGVCLTAVAATPTSFTADVSAATIAVTTLGRLAPQARVNLEPPLKAGDPLDGHIVTGHVDGVGEVVSVASVGGSLRLVVRVPEALKRYIAAKGSVAVDGVSLTIAGLDDRRCDVMIVPYTRAHTTLGDLARGDRVNLECDVLGKYVLRATEIAGLGDLRRR